MAALSRLILCVRDVHGCARFLTRVGLQLQTLTDTHAQLQTTAPPGVVPITLTVEQAANEAEASTGFSPFLEFQVAESLDTLVPALLSAGAHMDGRIVYAPTHKLAVVRAPFGAMLSLVEAQAPAPTRVIPRTVAADAVDATGADTR